jgi:AAA15 family ATPase/GTPase
MSALTSEKITNATVKMVKGSKVDFIVTTLHQEFIDFF